MVLGASEEQFRATGLRILKLGTNLKNTPLGREKIFFVQFKQEKIMPTKGYKKQFRNGKHSGTASFQ